jgi:hypothetical protein
MYARLFKFFATALTLLTANLLTSYISNLLISYKYDIKPLRFTLISMGIIILVFYPLFMKLEALLNLLSKKFVKIGHSVAGKYLGLIFMFAIGLFILMYFYAKMWYHINIFEMLFQGRFFKSL